MTADLINRCDTLEPDWLRALPLPVFYESTAQPLFWQYGDASGADDVLRTSGYCVTPDDGCFMGSWTVCA